jgi:two-component system CheB/CheR fusion protein
MTSNKEKQSKQENKISSDESCEFPIVGIGASAGGLEAFESFFKAMSADAGIAFVVVAHLDPTHASILPELIQKKTRMKVLQVADNMKVLPNQVYIIPPNKEMAILNGSLQLMEMPKPRGANLPIDSFLRSLAQDQGGNAGCIILSGTGSDGTLGLRAIKGQAGMAMVQDEESAKYDGMPRSAMATGLVDHVLPAEKMPEQLLKYFKHVMKKSTAKVYDQDEKIQNALQKIFILLRTSTGTIFLSTNKIQSFVALKDECMFINRTTLQVMSATSRKVNERGSSSSKSF